MISDQERREVAAKLRGLDERIDGVALMCTKLEHDAMALRAIRAVVGKGDIFHLLADLIDRPTCRNEEDSYDRTFLCSACGYEAYTYSDSNCNPHDFSYCPECGAEVVE